MMEQTSCAVSHVYKCSEDTEHMDRQLRSGSCCRSSLITFCGFFDIIVVVEFVEIMRKLLNHPQYHLKGSSKL